MGWLHAFDVNLARSGQNPQFAGGRLRVRGTGLLKGEPHPTALLHLAAKITAREKDAQADRERPGTEGGHPCLISCRSSKSRTSGT